MVPSTRRAGSSRETLYQLRHYISQGGLNYEYEVPEFRLDYDGNIPEDFKERLEDRAICSFDEEYKIPEAEIVKEST